MNIKFYIAALVAVMALGLVGCQNTAEGVSQDAKENVDKAEKTADKVEDAVEDTADKVGDAAKAAGKEVVEETKEAVAGPDTTFRIRTALEQAKLHIDDLNVDTFAEEKRVVLKGSAHSEDDKNRAATIAKGVLGGDMKIDNQITVSGGGGG